MSVTLVTGASSGFGRLTAHALAPPFLAPYFAVADRIRAEFYHRVGIEGPLAPNAAL
jgi:NAD(P)-dependent dehydrogenase (short-subunit alcohol dehydrogenase family)